MSKKDRWFAFLIGAFVAILAFLLDLDYSNIASEGLTLSSIVLAVYVAAIMGLIGSKLSQKMADTIAVNGEYTQLWVLRSYFKHALVYAIATIILSSLVLLFPEVNVETSLPACVLIYRVISALALAIYSVNLFFIGITLKFMLNRQIWNT